MLSLALETAV